MWIFSGSSGCSLVQKSPMATLFLSSMKFATKAITQIETRFFWRNRVTKLRCQRQRPALLRCFAIRRGLCRCSDIHRQEAVLHGIWWWLVNLCLTHGTAAGKYAGRLLKANCAAQPRAAPLALWLGRAIKCKSTYFLHWSTLTPNWVCKIKVSKTGA